MFVDTKDIKNRYKNNEDLMKELINQIRNTQTPKFDASRVMDYSQDR